MDKRRRKVLKAIAVGSGAMLAKGFTGSIGAEIFNTIFKPKEIGEVEKEALGVLLGKSETLPSIYAGEGNALARAKGLQGISNYLTYSSSQFSGFIGRAFKSEIIVSDSNSSDIFSYDARKNSIFLGGPAANDITSRLLGYRQIEITRNEKIVSFPTVDRASTVTRWAQLYGETGYGIYNGKLELARRFSARTGEEVNRPVYKLLDKMTGEVQAPVIEDNFLMSEWLTIVRVKDEDSIKVVIGGMHGYSTEAFCRDISRSLEQLHSIAGPLEQYQVVVPVTLTHRVNRLSIRYTAGEIDWKGAKVHEIRV
jgi:hypothetical protein